jgi:DNA (cytosine-5)-methyltransferase 1
MTRLEPHRFSVVEICAGAGGQSLGLHKAGFDHQLAVEIDESAAETLRVNGGWDVAVGDVANPNVWSPAAFTGVDLLAGGVPCPPFSSAGRQLGPADERDLFAWAIELVEVIRPRALMLENVRGLASRRFSAYRQRVLDRLAQWGYVGEWKLVTSADFGVAQLRPRFVLVAMQEDDHRYFRWPEPTVDQHVSVGMVLRESMAAHGWKYADEWSALATGVGPTLVGGSKKHGGADLGPSRAKEGWRRLYVDGRGIADAPPSADAPSAHERLPRLTIEMAAQIQGWDPSDNWTFMGRKTARYRQVGNAFPPPVAEAIGSSIDAALRRQGVPRADSESSDTVLHDPVYRALASTRAAMTLSELVAAQNAGSLPTVERKLAALSQDFDLEVTEGEDGVTRYRLGEFKGFVGQADHRRHQFVEAHRARVS